MPFSLPRLDLRDHGGEVGWWYTERESGLKHEQDRGTRRGTGARPMTNQSLKPGRQAEQEGSRCLVSPKRRPRLNSLRAKVGCVAPWRLCPDGSLLSFPGRALGLHRAVQQ